VEVDAAEIRGLDSLEVDGRCKPSCCRNSSLDSVEVDAAKPAWRSMRPKFDARIPWKWMRKSRRGGRFGDKGGVKFSRTSNRGPQIFWASRINQHSLCTPKCLNSCIEFLNVLNGIGAEAFNGQLTEIWKLGSDGIDGSKFRT